jgi:hypothetical protein
MTSNGSGSGLGLDRANPTQGRELIPSGTTVELVMAIRPGSIGEEGLCKRSANGKAEMLDTVFTVRGGPWDGSKIYDNMVIRGTEAGHATAWEISAAKLRAILEAVHGLDPSDNSPAAVARRASATLAGFHGATILATVEIEKGGKRPDGGNYKDRNVLGKILRIGDTNYRRLDQPPPAPIQRSEPPVQPQPGAAATAPHGSPAVAPAPIAKPKWAE